MHRNINFSYHMYDGNLKNVIIGCDGLEVLVHKKKCVCSGYTELVSSNNCATVVLTLLDQLTKKVL